MAADSLNAPHFSDPEKARTYLESQVWPKGPVCPRCGVIGGHYELNGKTTRPGLYKCKDCRQPFTVTVGTVFERSKIPLNLWLKATYLLCASKKGMSSLQLKRMLGVTYKTAWFMTHRIREAMTSYGVGKFMGGPGSSGIVEADETYWGNLPGVRRAGNKHKMPIVALLERGGRVRSFHVPTVNAANLKDVLRKNVSKSAHLMTDESSSYIKIGREFKKHSAVNHKRLEYARGEVTTNTVEGYFSILKRGLIGTYHHVGENHLQRYVREFDFRYNHRSALGVNDTQRADAALKGICGKRLTYRRTDLRQNA
ncbi:MAG: IS1595 family transposase [Burkholderiales bacterium]